MASAYVARDTRSGAVRFKVLYRLGGRDSSVRHAGSFPTQREARILAVAVEPPAAEHEAAAEQRQLRRVEEVDEADVRVERVHAERLGGGEVVGLGR